jgi:type II secretory pathway pseudopilin PulG
VSRRRAFTLLELLLAIGLSLALLGAMFGFLWDLLETRRQVVEETMRRRAVATLIDHVERDLNTVIVGDGVVGAGIDGDGTAITLLSRAVPAHRAMSGPGAFADLERSEYRFDAAAKSITVRRSDPAAGAAGPSFTLGTGVYRVQFRYFDGRVWRDTFRSLDNDRLPRAVEIAVWLDAWPGELEAFEEPMDDFTLPERSTFDAGDAFDERAFAFASDVDAFDVPPPDRIRVINVPDAAPPDEPADASAPGGGF